VYTHTHTHYSSRALMGLGFLVVEVSVTLRYTTVRRTSPDEWSAYF